MPLTFLLLVILFNMLANGIPVGPGRGSAAGSLVAYALGITNIDPSATTCSLSAFLIRKDALCLILIPIFVLNGEKKLFAMWPINMDMTKCANIITLIV
jgi:DNA polymerase III, alpha subunit (EC 2.7.7.7)